MALNIAVPLSGLGGLSPISPIGIDCWENIKILVSPIGSESSGVSSLDSDDAKQQIKPTPQKKTETLKQDIRIYYDGRNVLDLYNNVETSSTNWKFRYSHLPERNNISMFWANRSLYNRLGPNGLTPVYTINKCECCDFQYTSDCPNSYLSDTSLILSSTTTSPVTFTTASMKNKHEHHNTKVTTASSQQLTSTMTPVHNQQPFSDYKSSFELFNYQINVNKAKFNDVLLKKTSHLTNINTINYNNIDKYNNLFVNNSKTANDMTQLASALVAANASNSPSITPPPNVSINNYNSGAIHQNGYNELMTSNAKSIPPNNILNSSLMISNSTIPATVSHNFHNSHANNTNNNVPVNYNNNNNNTNNSSNNKTQMPSTNNFYSLFNSSNTNNSAMYAFNANGSNNNNNNTYTNSLNSMSNSNNSSNPLTVNSNHYGRMYKYF